MMKQLLSAVSAFMLKLSSWSRLSLTLSLMLLPLITACDRRELEVMDPRTVRVRLVVDWVEYFGEEPPGMTLVLFDDDNRPLTTVTSSTNSIYLEHLEIGHYRLVIFNKSVDDFPSMHFEQMNSFEQMTARATTFTPSRYTAWTQGETFTYDPELLGTLVDEFDITEEMLLSQTTFYPYKEWMHMVRTGEAPGQEVMKSRGYMDEERVFVIEVYPRPVTTQLYVRVHITNHRNMASIEGHITGFADGWLLTEDHATTNDDTRYLLDKWTVSDDAELSGNGWAVATTTLWGEPHGLEPRSNRRDDQHLLTLHITLRDGRAIDYLYNVGQDVRYVTRVWGDEWSYTEAVTKTLVVTIWDRDPGNDPGKPDDPGSITPDPDKPDDPGGPDDPDNPDHPDGPSDPDNPDEPNLPDVEGKDETGKSGWGVDVDPWTVGRRVDIPI